MKKHFPVFTAGLISGIAILGCLVNVTPQGPDFRYVTNGRLALDTLDGTVHDYQDNFTYRFSNFAVVSGDRYVGRFALLENPDFPNTVFDTASGTLIRIDRHQNPFVRIFPPH